MEKLTSHLYHVCSDFAPKLVFEPSLFAEEPNNGFGRLEIADIISFLDRIECPKLVPKTAGLTK